MIEKRESDLTLKPTHVLVSPSQIPRMNISLEGDRLCTLSFSFRHQSLLKMLDSDDSVT